MFSSWAKARILDICRSTDRSSGVTQIISYLEPEFCVPFFKCILYVKTYIILYSLRHSRLTTFHMDNLLKAINRFLKKHIHLSYSPRNQRFNVKPVLELRTNILRYQKLLMVASCNNSSLRAKIHKIPQKILVIHNLFIFVQLLFL